jgi:hypothetical protein
MLRFVLRKIFMLEVERGWRPKGGRSRKKKKGGEKKGERKRWKEFYAPL